MPHNTPAYPGRNSYTGVGLRRKGNRETQIAAGHTAQDSVSEEQGNTGSLGRQPDVTDSRELSRSHSNDATSPTLRLTSCQLQVEVHKEGLDLELGKDSVLESQLRG